MANVPTAGLIIDEATAKRWQASLNLLASVTGADAAVMRRLAGRHIETFLCSDGERSPYFAGEFVPTGRGVLCEKVITENAEVDADDASVDAGTAHSPDVARGLRAYAGVPLIGPDGSVFSSVALLARESGSFTPQDRELLRLVRLSLTTDLETLSESAISRPFREMAELSRDLICRFSADGTFLYASPAATDVIGYDPEELIGRQALELVHPDDVATLHARVESTTGGRCEARLLRKDGQYAWMEASVTARPHGDGFTAVIRDVTERKTLTAQVQASEALFRAAYEQAITPFALISADGTVIRANHAFAAFTGYTDDELQTLQYADLRIPAERELVLERQQRLASGDVSSFSGEREFVRKDGTHAWAIIGVAAIPTDDGSISKFTLQAIDTTDQHAAGSVLAEHEARLRAIVDNSPAGILLTDVDGKCIEANAAFAALLDRSREDLATATLKTFVHPEDLKEVSRLQSALSSGAIATAQSEIQVLRGDGTFAWTLATSSAVRDEAGEYRYSITHFVDITERKERELKLALLERALNASHTGVVICDARQKDFPIVAVNPSWEQITGYTQEEALGRNARFLRGDDTESDSIEKLRDGLRKAVDVTVKLTNQHKDGHPVWVELSVSPVRGADGKVSHFVGVMQDLSYRREADAAVKHAEERFQLATAAVEGAVYDWDLLNDTVEWTEGLQRVFGFPAETRRTNGSWYVERLHPEDRDRAVAQIATAMDGGERSYAVDYRWQRHDGEFREVWDKGVIQRDDAGRPTRVVGTIGDVTERARARKAQAEAEAAERSALNSVPFYIDTVEQPSRTLYLSPGAAELYGVSREQWQADPSGYTDGVVHPDDLFVLQQSIAKQGSGDDHDAEYRIRRPDGSVRWLLDRVSIARDADGRPLFAQGVLSDITERKEAELAREAAEAERVAEEQRRRAEEEIAARQAEVARAEEEARRSELDADRAPQDSPPDAEAPSAEAADEAEPAAAEAPALASEGEAAPDDFSLDKPPTDGTADEPTPLFDGAQRREADADLLFQIETKLKNCQSTSDAFNAITGLVNQLFPNLTGAIYATNSARSHAEMATVWNNSQDLAVSFQVHDCWALKMGSTYRGEPSKGRACEHLSEPHTSAYMCVPLQSPEGPLGILYLAENREGALTAQAQESAVGFAEKFGAALHATASADTARTSTNRDRATGLYNRTHAEELLAKELSRIADGRGSLAVVMVDVDNLRRVNTELGHKAGDTVIKEVSAHLQRNIRKEEIAARFGDDEFMLVFLDMTADDARQRAEGVREAVKLLDIKVSGKPVGKVTCSFGIAVCPDNGLARDVLIRAARAALLRAKRDGRDLVASAYNPDRQGRTS